jgi:putative transposase
MRQGRFAEEQMVAIIREAARESVSTVAKRHRISEQPIYPWRKRFRGFQANQVGASSSWKAENVRLTKLVAERDLEIEVMKEVAAKTGERAGSSASNCVGVDTLAVKTAPPQR